MLERGDKLAQAMPAPNGDEAAGQLHRGIEAAACKTQRPHGKAEKRQSEPSKLETTPDSDEPSLQGLQRSVGTPECRLAS